MALPWRKPAGLPKDAPPVEFEAQPGPAADAAPAAPGKPGFLKRLLRGKDPNAGERHITPLKRDERHDAATRKRAVAEAEADWRERFLRPFMAWLVGQIPSTDVLGPGGLRFASDSLWSLARFHAELHVWQDRGFDPPDVAALREGIALDRRNFEVVHRFLMERHPRVTPPWAVPPFTDDRSFWLAFREAAHAFEQGHDDGKARATSREEGSWVAGLTGMMALAVSWASFRPAAPPASPPGQPNQPRP